MTILRGRARVDYTNMTLTAEKITVDWDTRELVAEGVLDTVWTANETGDSVQTEQLVGLPEFTQAGDVMRGERMKYNMKTKKAFVLRGRTEHDEGFYHGRAMKLTDRKQIYVGDARFTTCDKEEDLHFHFWSKQMKIMINDKVVARPVVMYLGKIPVMALPFALFPIKKGRHSGLLMPKYGESTTEGRSIRGLGYYWAASNYWDAKATVNYYEKSGFLFRGDIRYQKRYALRGNISGSFTRKNFEVSGTRERRWDLHMTHSHEISPTTRLSVNATLVSSDNLYRETSANPQEIARGNISSNATLTKRIGGSGNLSINLNQNRNIREDAAASGSPHITETIPQISFSNRWSNLIPTGNKQVSRQRWYQKISVPYNINFLGKRKRTVYREGYGETKTDEGMGVKHNLRILISPKLFGWLQLQPNLNYDEVWIDRRNRYFLDPESNKIDSKEEQGFFAVRTFNTGVSANTKIYGLFRSRFIPDVQIRHVLTPSISFSYQPDFTDEKWHYYVDIADTTGTVYEKNRYSGGVISPSLGSESQSMGFSVNNVFQMKKGQGEDVKKFDLFSYRLSSSYNWKAQTHRLSNLNSSLSARLFGQYRLSMNAMYSFYKMKENGRIQSNTLWIDDVDWSDMKTWKKLRLAQLTNISFNMDFSLKGKAGTGNQQKSGTKTTETGENPLDGDVEDPLQEDIGDRFESNEPMANFSIPWDIRSGFRYQKRITDDKARFYSDINLNFNLTPHWKISWRTQWDWVEKQFSSHYFNFYRDLHCWEAHITWHTGRYKRFYLRINIKSSMLKDIKVEKGAGRTGYFR
ncbi:LPS-assembly protein LptD [bacterium]|nr:LPS-assembly protein LptD [bacterium]